MENLIKDMKIQYPVSTLLKTKDRKCIIIKKETRIIIDCIVINSFGIYFQFSQTVE